MDSVDDLKPGLGITEGVMALPKDPYEIIKIREHLMPGLNWNLPAGECRSVMTDAANLCVTRIAGPPQHNNCKNRLAKRKWVRTSRIRDDGFKTLNLRNRGQKPGPGKRAQKRRTKPAPTVGAGFGLPNCARNMASFLGLFLED